MEINAEIKNYISNVFKKEIFAKIEKILALEYMGIGR